MPLLSLAEAIFGGFGHRLLLPRFGELQLGLSIYCNKSQTLSMAVGNRCEPPTVSPHGLMSWVASLQLSYLLPRQLPDLSRLAVIRVWVGHVREGRLAVRAVGDCE